MGFWGTFLFGHTRVANIISQFNYSLTEAHRKPLKIVVFATEDRIDDQQVYLDKKKQKIFTQQYK